MKHLFALSIFFIVSQQLFSIEVSHVILRLHDSNHNHSISVYEPIDKANNNFFKNAGKDYKETENDSIYNYKYTGHYPAYITFQVDDRKFRVLLFPRDSVVVSIYPRLKDWLEFQGSNARGHKWYDQWRGTLLSKSMEIKNLITQYSNDYEGSFLATKKYIEKDIFSFDSIAATHCSAPFNMIMRQNIYANLHSEVIDKYNAVIVHNRNNTNYKTDSAVIRRIQQRIFEQYPPFSPNILACELGFSYILSYVNTLKKHIPSDSYFGIYSAYENFPPEIQKPCMGYLIALQFVFAVNEFDIQKAITYFRGKYPDSEYLPIIDALQKQALDKKSQMLDTSGIFIDSMLVVNNTKTIKDFHQRFFPDQKIYIDLWATWCIPCKSEFMYKDALYPIAKKYNIKLVYLSIDQITLKNKWISDILRLNLKGYHFIVNEALLDDFEKNIYITQSLSVPRYVYINEKGEIVSRNAPRPSGIRDLEMLFSGK